MVEFVTFEMEEVMEKLSAQQLQIINKLNNLLPDENCVHGCIDSCWRATKAASNALEGDFTDPVEEYQDCVNGLVISLTMTSLREMS